MRAVIVQARMGSTRLPGKVLLPLNGRTVLGEVLSRCLRITADAVVCAIPTSDFDRLGQIAHDAGAIVVCGPEHDVLSRYVRAAEYVGADEIMRVTADCPLICPELCTDVFNRVPEFDYASNVHPRTFPKGMDCEAFTMDVLLRADKHSKEREHVTTWMLSAPIRRTNVACPWNLEGRLTLDTFDDYQTIRASFEDIKRAA